MHWALDLCHGSEAVVSFKIKRQRPKGSCARPYKDIDARKYRMHNHCFPIPVMRGNKGIIILTPRIRYHGYFSHFKGI